MAEGFEEDIRGFAEVLQEIELQKKDESDAFESYVKKLKSRFWQNQDFPYRLAKGYQALLEQLDKEK